MVNKRKGNIEESRQLERSYGGSDLLDKVYI